MSAQRAISTLASRNTSLQPAFDQRSVQSDDHRSAMVHHRYAESVVLLLCLISMPRSLRWMYCAIGSGIGGQRWAYQDLALWA